MLTLELIQAASAILNGKIRKTPLEYSERLSDHLGIHVYLKLECLQITGSFKVRGALFYLSTLDGYVLQKGVAACSAGNHGLGVAYASKQLNVPCTVYVPKNVDRAKEEKILSLGARIKKSVFLGYDDTLAWAKQEVAKTGEHLISAFDDERIMAGNGGTLAQEIFEDLPTTKNILFPIGGGGLGAGIAQYIGELYPQVRLIGCQHVESPGFERSLKAGRAMTYLPAIDTIAAGLEGGIGALCFPILQRFVKEVFLASEKEIREACSWMLEHHQYLIEPTAAAAIAGAMYPRFSKLQGPTVILLSGRNVAYSTLVKLLESVLV